MSEKPLLRTVTFQGDVAALWSWLLGCSSSKCTQRKQPSDDIQDPSSHAERCCEQGVVVAPLSREGTWCLACFAEVGWHQCGKCCFLLALPLDWD